MTPEDIAKLPYRPCVGIMLTNADGAIFVGQRLDRDTDAWQMPQGGVDPGEDSETAALRELEEETGITTELVTITAQSKGEIPYDLPHELVPKLWKGRYRGQAQRWFLMRFNGRDAQVDIQTKVPEFAAWKWLPADQLVDAIVPFKKEVYRKVMAEFQDLL